MAQPCSAALVRFDTTLAFSSSSSSSANPTSCSDTTTLTLPSHLPFPSSKLRNIAGDKKNARNYAVRKGLKSVYSGGLRESKWSSFQGISSIRDDIQVPSSHFQVNCVYGQEWPPLVVQEGLQFVASKLFEHRIIRCSGPIDADMANFIVAQLLYLDAVDPNKDERRIACKLQLGTKYKNDTEAIKKSLQLTDGKDIVMYVNSPGGSVSAGMAIFDMMRHIRPDVSTVCVGLAASIGAFLLAAGTKGKRYSLPDSRIMIHQALSGAQGFGYQINIQANEIAFHKANLATHLALFSGQNIDQVYRDTEEDKFMSPKEAKEYGLIDGIIMNPRKALQPLTASAAGAG